jgi:hypothetical protein
VPKRRTDRRGEYFRELSDHSGTTGLILARVFADINIAKAGLYISSKVALGSDSLSDNVISYLEMCRREGTSLQAGMNFVLGGNHSVILMSLRANAPYRDRLEDSGTILIYERHDQPKGADCANPKIVDQPDQYPSESLTRNGNSTKLRSASSLVNVTRSGSASTSKFDPVCGDGEMIPVRHVRRISYD